jgi:hypothetical protein
VHQLVAAYFPPLQSLLCTQQPYSPPWGIQGKEVAAGGLEPAGNRLQATHRSVQARVFRAAPQQQLPDGAGVVHRQRWVPRQHAAQLQEVGEATSASA